MCLDNREIGCISFLHIFDIAFRQQEVRKCVPWPVYDSNRISHLLCGHLTNRAGFCPKLYTSFKNVWQLKIWTKGKKRIASVCQVRYLQNVYTTCYCCVGQGREKNDNTVYKDRRLNEENHQWTLTLLQDSTSSQVKWSAQHEIPSGNSPNWVSNLKRRKLLISFLFFWKQQPGRPYWCSGFRCWPARRWSSCSGCCCSGWRSIRHSCCWG